MMLATAVTAAAAVALLVNLSSSITSQPRSEFPKKSSPAPFITTPSLTEKATTAGDAESDYSWPRLGDESDQKGRCELFNDTEVSICKPFRSNRTVYVDARPGYGQRRIADFISDFTKGLQSVVDSQNSHSQCKMLIVEGVCTYCMPDCQTDNSGEAITPRLCKKSCQALFHQQHLCHNVFVAAVGSSAFLADLKKFDAIHTNVTDFQCDGLPSVARDNEICYTLHLDIPTPTPPAPVEPTISDVSCEIGRFVEAQDANCTFPFTYQEIKYTECTTVGLQYRNFRPWCAATGVAKEQPWTNCHSDRRARSDKPIQINGTCAVYNGGDLCGSNGGRAGSLVFVDSRYNQSYLSAVLHQTLENVTGRLQLNGSCSKQLVILYCRMLYPDCLTVTIDSQNYTYPAPLSSEACSLSVSEYVSSCKSSLYQEAIVLSQWHFSERSINPIQMVYELLNCSELPSSQCLVTPTPNLTNGLTTNATTTDRATTVNASVIGLTVLCTVTILVILIIVSKRYIKSRQEPVMVKPASLEMQNPRVEGSWDSATIANIRSLAVCPSRLTVEKEIGEGNFGKVYKCQLDGTTVAAKSAKADVQDFISEALRMKSLSHPNVMSLIGICWSSNPQHEYHSKPLVLLPYMVLKDLKTYLMKERLETPAEDERNEIFTRNVVVQLIQFEYQIAKGMEYLSEKGILHRDLAARNCMVEWDLTIKVADFGLARALEEDKHYYRVTPGKAQLPIRWVALEGVLDGIFTTKSDVWSYGITLWEVMTMGRIPYPGIALNDLAQLLEEGMRLNRPKNCPDEIYKVMTDCWIEQPSKRPSFSNLVSSIGEYTLATKAQEYVRI